MTFDFYSPKSHLLNLINKPYYKNLIKLRNVIGIGCDSYFQSINAPRVDLFMFTKAVSSPTGRGSDSKPIAFRYANENAFLVDSAQFGMEPLVQKAFDVVYCYLPSFRGEKADSRHLNQFYHCESEMKGDYIRSMEVAEGLVKYLVRTIISFSKKGEFTFKKNNFEKIYKIINKKFPVITFDEADHLLHRNHFGHLIIRKPYGRILSNEAELKIAHLVGKNLLPVWVTLYDRDTVAFYQKPVNNNIDKVYNADLIFPSIGGGFGGEIIGSGQRQNNSDEILESIRRQGINNHSQWDWYINMRKAKDYEMTSGFGLGIERLIAWVLGLPSIVDTAIYPVMLDRNLI